MDPFRWACAGHLAGRRGGTFLGRLFLMQGKRSRSVNFTSKRYLSPIVWAFLGLMVGYLGLSAMLLKTHRRSMGNGASTAYAGGVLGVELDGGIGRSLSAVVCSHVRFISNIKYSSERSGRQFEYQLSLHDTEQDLVVSKLLLESNGTYGTVSEVHAVCEGGQDGGYGIDCEKGKTFVEVGSALGHVSMYMATRGMRVVAIDPLEANIERVQESMCLNGVATCLKGSPPRSTGAQEREGDRCSQSSEWLSYSPKHVLAIFALVSNEANESLTLVESEPYNLAATIKGRGNVSSLVKTITLDSALASTDIELLYLTCQGCEARAIEGAKGLISSGKVRNIIWRLHSYNQVQSAHRNSMEIAEYLLSEGYVFYHMEDTRLDHKSTPRVIPNASVIDYVTTPREDHPEILASRSPSKEALNASKDETVPDWLFSSYFSVDEDWEGLDGGNRYMYEGLDMDGSLGMGNDSTWAGLGDGEDGDLPLLRHLSNVTSF